MRFYCLDCGRYMNQSDLKEVQESRGEYWGTLCYETMVYCPYCDGDVISEEDDDFPKEDDGITEDAREWVEEISKVPSHYSRNPLDDIDLEDDDDFDD